MYSKFTQSKKDALEKMKLNKTSTHNLIKKREALLKIWPTTYKKIENDKKVCETLGKGCEKASRYFRHVSEELERRGL